MLLILGGAMCGKRKYVKERLPHATWISAYNHDLWEVWEEKWQDHTPLIIEGFEQWIEKELESGKNMQETLQTFQTFIETLGEEEKRRECPVAFIMLEMGRGIVPMSKKDRDLRDIAGWLLQYAAKKADEVIYIWHGLAKRIG